MSTNAAQTAHSAGFGIYVHWPYCAAKCPYCDFNSHVPRGAPDERRYAEAIIRELRHCADLVPDRRADTIFFGGGTPSLMSPETVGAIIEAVDGLWPLSPAPEITLEANPSSVEAGRFAGYRAAGVNRVSLGVQSLRDEALRFLGRLHSADEARAAVGVAMAHFERVSIDLIYARPGQAAAAWSAELREALALGVGHLSAYQLTIEPGTMFHRLHAAGKLQTPPDDAASDLFEVTQEVCEDAGLHAYEVSNHTVPGEESRHNLIYWRYGEYAGVGPGAHGRLRLPSGDQLATVAISDPAKWLAAVERQGIACEEPPAGLDGLAQAEEMLMMGLRLTEGLARDRLRALTGHDVGQAALSELAALGMIDLLPGGCIRLTGHGRLLLNRVTLKLAESLAPVAPARGAIPANV